MYDYDDEATHELLYWNYNRDLFHFHDEDNYADRDLTIEITYAGTPTEMYGITTEWGNGGYLELIIIQTTSHGKIIPLLSITELSRGLRSSPIRDVSLTRF